MAPCLGLVLIMADEIETAFDNWLHADAPSYEVYEGSGLSDTWTGAEVRDVMSKAFTAGWSRGYQEGRSDG